MSTPNIAANEIISHNWKSLDCMKLFYNYINGLKLGSTEYEHKCILLSNQSSTDCTLKISVAEVKNRSLNIICRKLCNYPTTCSLYPRAIMQ